VFCCTSEVLESVLTLASLTPSVASARETSATVVGRSYVTVTSVPPVNDKPRRSACEGWKPPPGACVACQNSATTPSAMIAYEIVETVRNHPTTFQFNRRKNIPKR
jgi:hypothetical protein